MFASTSELKARTCASLVVRIYKVGIALATYDLDQFTFDLDLERVIFQFDESTTALIDTQRSLQVFGLTLAPFDVCNNLVTI
jgi:hypothetical protein